MLPDRILSLALGRPDQPSGLVLLERYETIGEWSGRRYDVKLSYIVAAIEREPRSDGYEGIAARAAHLWPVTREGNSSGRGVVLADVGSSGRAALAPFSELGLKVVPLDITSAIGARGVKRRAFEIGSAEIISTAAVVQSQRRISIGAGVDALELAEQVRSAREKSEGIELAHALSMGLFWGEHRWRSRLEQPRPPGEAATAWVEAACRPPTFAEVMKAAERRRA